MNNNLIGIKINICILLLKNWWYTYYYIFGLYYFLFFDVGIDLIVKSLRGHHTCMHCLHFINVEHSKNNYQNSTMNR